MAEMVPVRTFDAKRRSPGLIVLWSVLTLGIYTLFWYYFVNKELMRYGQALAHDGETDPETSRPVDSGALGTDPWLSVLAVTIGGLLIVPPYVSIYRFFNRTRRAQTLAGIRHDRVSPGLGLVLAIVSFLLIYVLLALGLWAMYGQSHLNKIWAIEAGKAGAPPSQPAQRRLDQSSPSPTEKACPDCAEAVKAEARVCRHCGFRFPDA